MSKDVKQTKGRTRLSELDASEVSLVPSGANKRRFLIFKSSKRDIVGIAAKIRERVLKADPAVMGKVRELILRHQSGQTGPDAFGMQEGAATQPDVNAQHAAPKTAAEAEGGGDPVAKEGGADATMQTEDGAGAGMPAGQLSKQAEAALQAVVRILTPFKAEVPSGLLHEVLKVAGFQAPPDAEPGTTHAGTGKPPGEHPDPEPKEAEFQALPAAIESEETDFLEGVTKDHMVEAGDAAEGAYKETMKKNGYEKFPIAKMGVHRGGANAADKTREGETVSKSSSAPGLDKIKDPETRRVLEAVQKSNLELVKKNADLEKSLADSKALERKKEIVQKAGSFKHLGLPQDDLVAQLVDADKQGSESYERVCKNFTALNEQAEKGKLFSEIGSSQGSAGASDDMDAKLWAMADGIVQKSSTPLTREQAYTKAAESPAGQRLYAEYKAMRPNGI